MFPEVEVYRVLNGEKKLNDLMDAQRGTTLEEQMIFSSDVPEMFHKIENAPLVVIYGLPSEPIIFTDDAVTVYERAVQVSFWTHNKSEALAMINIIDPLLKSAGYVNYYSEPTEKDKDTSDNTKEQLYMTIRNYRFVGLG